MERSIPWQQQVEARIAEVAHPEEIEAALVRLAKEGAQGLVVLPSGIYARERQRILKFALAQRWPVVARTRVYAEEGALLTYGADATASYRRAAYQYAFSSPRRERTRPDTLVSTGSE